MKKNIFLGILLLVTQIFYSQKTIDALPISSKIAFVDSNSKKYLSERTSDKIKDDLTRLSSSHEFNTFIINNTKRGTRIGLNTFQSNLGGLKKFLPNVFIQSGKELVFAALDNWKENEKDDYRNKLNNYTKAVIVRNSHLEVNSSELKSQISALFFDSNIRPEDYPVLGKRFDQVIFNYVQENKEELEAFKKETNTKINELEVQGVTNSDAVKQVSQNVTDNAGNIISLQNSRNNLETSLAKLELSTHERFSKFETQTIVWQRKVHNDMADLGEKINSNSEKINQNREEIKKIKKEVQDNTYSIKVQEKKLKNLEFLQIENRGLILKNRIRIDALGSVLYGEASTEGKIKMIKNGLVKFESPEEKEDELGKLSNIKSWEEFNSDLAMGKEIVRFASNLGLDNKTVEDANKVIGALSLVGQFAASYPSSPLGMLQSVNGAFDLFKGGGGSNGPNPALMAELAAIKKTLSEINGKLDVINENIETLIENQYAFHKENLQQFNSLHSEIQELKIINSYVMQLILNQGGTLDHSILPSIVNDMSNAQNSLEFGHYNEILTGYGNHIPELLKKLFKNSYSSEIMASEYIHISRTNDSADVKKFIPLKDYALSRYKRKFIMEGLQFIGLYTDSNFKLTSSIKTEDLNWNKAFSNMTNPKDLSQLIELNLIFAPYFLLKKGNNPNNFTTYTTEEFKRSSIFIVNRKVKTELTKYKNLDTLVSYTLAQQSLLAGNKLLPHLFNDLGTYENEPRLSSRKVKAYNAINQNSIIKMNLATYILNKSILSDDSLRESFINVFNKSKNFKISDDELIEINQSIGKNWRLKQVERGKFFELYLYTELIVNGKKREVFLPIDYQLMMTNEMIYPRSVDKLIDIQSKLKQKIIEFEFQDILNNNSKEEYVKEFNKIFQN